MSKLFFVSFVLAVFCQCSTSSKKSADSEIPGRQWWKEAVVYQIYPRSFKDTDGDGVGDLKGIIEKLDYIKSLGIDVVWLNPIYGSPNDDNGYDISDYQDIMAEFGNMADFDVMLQGMHDRGIKLVMDLVVNHSSDEHRWFQESRTSRDNAYRDYYHWWPAEKGKPAKRVSFFDVNNDAWLYDSTTNAYYLHYFSRKQPDLNWENPKLREEIYSMMRFWFDKGIDGFRMDVIPFISKDTTFPEITPEELNEKYHGDWAFFYGHGPHIHDYMQEMNREVLSKYDIMTVGEGAGTVLDDALLYTDPDRHELNMFYHFEGVSIGYLPGKFKVMDPDGYKLTEFKDVYSKWDSVFAEKGWGTVYLGNHDQPRMVSRWGNDAPEYRAPSSKMLTTFLLSMRATPYYYFGDELGMSNIKFDSIGDYKDIETLTHYKFLQNTGGDIAEFIESQKISARDNGRTPFQWDNTKNAGFTDGTPWIKVNSNYATVNVETEEIDPNSCLNYFRKMVKTRKDNPVLIYGKYHLLDKDNPNIYAYTRELNGATLLVVLNFTDENQVWDLPKGENLGGVLINNYNDLAIADGSFKLRPYQAIITELE
ncbi:glycoside hydrolase family 13 protein [Mangrovibacterium lignilyticum]|uniref:glycoside hydrolase family 13 protein n=1 Tax=Mangrovibacterium lignilyticum TaxID=2668052 RepID=UPI0013D51D22|nr:alpha-glucosidase [Mangrovibacterium lignilyticum]